MNSPDTFLSLYNTVLKENDALEKTLNYIKETYSTDNQKIKYSNDQIDWFVFTNYYLFFLYFLFLVILCFVIFLRKKINYITLTVVGGFCIFPFLITTLEMRSYDIIVYIGTFVLGKTYPGNLI